uniref:Uncharacterized protein n=1 Tax=Rhizophora mucronata TaxID=61149 RepID=A0A2P2JXQ0_RHIMU
MVICSLICVFDCSQEELKNTTIRMAEQSKVLNTAGAEKQTKRELFDALRQELEFVFCFLSFVLLFLFLFLVFWLSFKFLSCILLLFDLRSLCN